MARLKFAQVLPLLIVILFKVIVAAPTDDNFEQLQAEVSQLKSEVDELTKTVHMMQTQLVTNIADQYADKTVQNIHINNQNEAAKFWMELLNHAKQSNRTDELLSKVITDSYSGKRSNFYNLLEFILKNKINSAFPLLYEELLSHGHLYNGQEVFVFAHYLKDTCGSNTQLYQRLPNLVQQIISMPIILQNTDNQGYVIASQHYECKDRRECYENPKSEAFIHKLSPSLSLSDVTKNPRSHWQFIVPTDMTDMRDGFNGTRMSWGFHIKNIAQDKFLIVKMRLTSYFLRNTTMFDPYFSGDLQCQFMPMLVEDNTGRITIGIKDKYVARTEFMHGSKFAKKTDKADIGRRNHKDLEGKVWQVTPVINSKMTSGDDSKEWDDNNNTLDVDINDSNNSKCQF